MKNKILSLIIAVCILVLPLTVISFASAEETALLTSAFYVDTEEKADIFAYIEDEEVTFELGKYSEGYSDDYEDYDYQYIYISILENTTGIDDVEKCESEIKGIFDYVVEEYLYLFDEVQFKSEISEINGYKCIKYYGIDDDTYYYTAYLLATKENVFCLLTETDDEDAAFITNAVKTFTVNGTLLNGDSHKNTVDFSAAKDYKEQAVNYQFSSTGSPMLDEETNKYARIGFIMFMIPFFVLFVITVIVIVKYISNKKKLEQYERTYGVMGMGMPPYMNNMNYGAPMNNSYMPQQPIQQPMQQPTQPMNQNYQAPTDNNGQSNNF